MSSKTAVASYSCFCGKPMEVLRIKGEPLTSNYGATSASLYRCIGCGHIAFFPRPSMAFLNGYYNKQWNEVDKAPLDQHYRNWSLDGKDTNPRKFIQRIIEITKRMGAAPGDIAIHDVGCGYGALVNTLAELGYRVSGSDINREKIEKGGSVNPHIFFASVEELAATHREQFHIVVAHHVLEHISDPLGFVTALRAALKPDGCFIWRVPNGTYLPAIWNSFLDNSWCFYPDHINYFTANSARELMERAGLDTVQVCCTPYEEEKSLLLLRRACVEAVVPVTLEPADAMLQELAGAYLTRELECTGTRHSTETAGKSTSGEKKSGRMPETESGHKVDALTAIFDTSRCTLETDFLPFILRAERERALRRLAHLDLILIKREPEHFSPIAAQFFRDDHLESLVRSFVLPVFYALPSARNVSMPGAGSREALRISEGDTGEGPIFSAADCSEDSEEKQRPRLMGNSSGLELLPSLPVSLEAAATVRGWIQKKAQDKKVVSIMLRACSYEYGKNSRSEPWRSFAGYLLSTGYYPVFFVGPESNATLTLELKENIYPEHWFPEATYSLDIRNALHAAGYLNLAVETESSGTLLYNRDARFLIFLGGLDHAQDQGAAGNSNMVWKKRPYLTPLQRIFENGEDFSLLVQVFELMKNLIELFMGASLDTLKNGAEEFLRNKDYRNFEWITRLATQLEPASADAWLLRFRCLKILGLEQDATEAGQRVQYLRGAG